MEKKTLISELTTFLTSEPACLQTLGVLSKKAEIGIVIADDAFISVQNNDGQITVEEKKSPMADFVFKSTPEAIEALINEKDLSPAQLGIKMMKQILNRDIQVTMPGSLLQIPRKGYFKILKVGGLEFLNELKKHGLTNVPQIIAALKNLKK